MTIATELPAHILTILDKVGQQVRTKPIVTKDLSSVASWHRALYAKDNKVCFGTALGSSFDGIHAEEVWVCLAWRKGYNPVVHRKKRLCALIWSDRKYFDRP